MQTPQYVMAGSKQSPRGLCTRSVETECSICTGSSLSGIHSVGSVCGSPTCVRIIAASCYRRLQRNVHPQRPSTASPPPHYQTHPTPPSPHLSQSVGGASTPSPHDTATVPPLAATPRGPAQPIAPHPKARPHIGAGSTRRPAGFKIQRSRPGRWRRAEARRECAGFTEWAALRRAHEGALASSRRGGFSERRCRLQMHVSVNLERCVSAFARWLCVDGADVPRCSRVPVWMFVRPLMFFITSMTTAYGVN